MRKLMSHIIVLIMLLFPTQIVCQKLSYLQFTMQDGLPTHMIYQISQDSTGLIWLGTENGLVSFNGTEFRRYTHPELADNDIIRMTLSSSGRIYFFNLSQQLCYLEDDQITIMESLKTKSPLTSLISVGSKDYVLILHSNNTFSRNIAYEIVKKPGEQYELIPSDISVFSTTGDSHFELWNSYGFHRPNDSLYLFQKYSELYSEKGYYVFTEKRNCDKIIEVDSAIWNLMFNDNEVSFHRFEGFECIIKNRKLSYFDPIDRSRKSFLEEFDVNSIFIDYEENGWISTPNSGLLMVPSIETQLQQTHNDINYGIHSIQKDSFGTIYLGNVIGEVIILSGDQQIVHKVSQEERPVNLYLYENIMFAYNEPGQKIIDTQSGLTILPSTFSNITRSLSIQDSIVYRSLDNKFTVNEFDYYFGDRYKGSQSVYHLKGRINTVFSSELMDSVIIGTAAGLKYFSDGQIKSSKIVDLNASNISAIIGDQDSTVWIGTRAGGIYQLKNDSVINHFDISRGLISNNVNHLEISGSELLVSTTKGLSIVYLESGQNITINSWNLLTANEILVCKKINNNYWIGTTDGLSVLSKEELVSLKESKPRVTLKNMFVNGSPHVYDKEIKLHHTENNLQFNFQNISFRSGREKFLRYRIIPADKNWQQTTDKAISFTSLKPGNYALEVKGVNSMGTESDALSYPFTIKAPWWDTIWGRLFLLSLFGMIGYGIFKYRINQEEQKRDFITQINKIKDQALQLQMNPHFIFNSLNAIQSFIGTDEETKAMNYLARFARLIRLIFEHSKGNTISIEEELEFIRLYLDLEKLRFKDKVEVFLNIGEEIEAVKDIVKIPPLLVQPIIENSFKHGLFHKNGKGIVEIKYELTEDILTIKVKDNGIGREAARKIRQKNIEKQKSSGIQTTQERIDLLNYGKQRPANDIVIKDLKDADGNSLGTEVILQLKIM